jgi:peptidoglycan/xylan/chitin deacetylase (PgdA/CDA1 family)
MTYSVTYHQPSLLDLARQGNFRAIAYWINSILGPKGVYIQTESTRSGTLKIMVNFQRSSDRETCMKARHHLVRHICYRLWTLNSAEIRDVRIMARVAGQKDILWRQSVRITAPAHEHPKAAPARPSHVARPGRAARPRQVSHPRSAGQESVQLLRSFLFNRIALAGFLLCYWMFYLEATGHQTAEQPSFAATSPKDPEKSPSSAASPQQSATPVAHETQLPQNLSFTVPPQFQGQVVYQATPPAGAEKVIALTFDDGPWQGTTEQILDILKQNNIKATFFFVGQAIQENPEIAKKVAVAGHAIGNHTWRHLMDDMDESTAVQELSNTAKLIYQATGARTHLMRPPGGNLGGELVNYAKKKGYLVTMWSADTSDYYVSTPLIIDNALRNAKPGGIVLMHDGGGDRTATVEALPQIISSLRRQGYKFVTVPELMQMQAKWGPIQPLDGTDTPMVTDTSVPSLPSNPSLPPTPTVPNSPPTPALSPQSEQTYQDPQTH